MKVSAFIKHTVIGQEPFVIARKDPPFRHNGRRIRQFMLTGRDHAGRLQLPSATRALAHIANNGHEPLTVLGNLIEGPPIIRHKSGLKQEIFWGIAGNRQLGKRHQIGFRLARFLNPAPNQTHIPGDITDLRIDLSHGNSDRAHQPFSTSIKYSQRP